MTNLADLKEVERVENGDRDAFARLYSLYRDRVYGFAYRMVGVHATAEDVTHEVFLALIQNPNRYDSAKGSLLTFLCAIARNQILTHFRRRGVEFEDGFDENSSVERIDENEIDPLSSVLNQELSVKVNEAIISLPALQREVIVLREFQDLSYEEISTVVGVEVNVVKARIHRARQGLSKRLVPYLITKGENCYELRRS